MMNARTKRADLLGPIGLERDGGHDGERQHHPDDPFGRLAVIEPGAGSPGAPRRRPG